MNKKIKIVTDSTADLSKDEINQLGITVVPLSITIDDKSYLDGVDITNEEFLKELKRSEKIPQTSQPSVGSFLEVYDELGKDGSEIISIHMTDGMSGTYRSAFSASELSESNVTVVNSKYISIALSFQVKRAVELVKDGLSVAQIVEELDTIRKNTSLYIMIDTLEYMLKGGRIGRGKALVGSLLKIKPVASLEDGVFTPVSKVRTYVQMIKFMKNRVEAETKGRIVKGIGIAQVEAKELALQVKEQLNDVIDYCEISIVDTSPIISAHAGPGALALMYYTEEK